MIKSDLKVGYVVELKNGQLYMVMPRNNDIILDNNDGFMDLNRYTDDFKLSNLNDDDYDIAKIYGFIETKQCSLAINSKDRPLLWERKDEPQEQPANRISNLNDFAKEVYENAKAHGWYDDNRTFGDVVALCHSELSEALEEYRNEMPFVYFVDELTGGAETDMSRYDGQKLEGVATEMIDCIIRILDWCGANDIDIENLLRLKHEYNKTRPYKHGGKIL